jgi:sugar-specific transcriptional regulator TrmB
MEKVNEILQELGFEGREIKVYLSLIKKDGMTASEVSKDIRIDRTTTYDILAKLIDKGIVSQMTKNGTKHFMALSPEDLLQHFRQKYSSLEGIMSELNGLSAQNKEPVKCELFQGKNGLKVVLKDLVASKKDYKAIGIRKEFEEILGYFNEQGIIKLDQFNVKEQAIVEKDSEFKKAKRGTYRYLNKKLLSPVTTLIYDNKVIFFIWTEPYFAIRVSSKTFFNAQEEYFRMLWGMAKG